MLVGFAGFVTVQLIRDGEITQEYKFKNLILDAGLTALAEGAQTLDEMLDYLAVGTGTAQPAINDTELDNEVARTNSDGGFTDEDGSEASFEYNWMRRTRLFLEPEAVGDLRELGFFSAAVGGTAWMRQLFMGPTGTIVIRKTSAERMRIIYELRVYPPMDDVTYELSGVTIVHRAAEVDSPQWSLADTPGSLLTELFFDDGNMTVVARETQTLGTREGQPAGTADAPTTMTVQPYDEFDPAQFTRRIALIWVPGEANFASGIGSKAFSIIGDGETAPMFQTSFDPEIAKTNTKRLEMSLLVTLARV